MGHETIGCMPGIAIPQTLTFARGQSPKMSCNTRQHLFFSAPCTFPTRAIGTRSDLPITPRCSLRGPSSPKPDYTKTDASPLNRFFLARFLAALRAELHSDAPPPPPATPTLPGYDAVIATVRSLALRDSAYPGALRAASVRVLSALIPVWLPRLFAGTFSAQSPRLAARMCASVTVACTQWLMGSSGVGDNGTSVEIDRCRYLEETACAGVCLHSCKTATEQFFLDTMALPLHVEPDFDDFSCTFRFGETPPQPKDDPIFREPCFAQCPITGLAREPVCDFDSLPMPMGARGKGAEE